MAPVTPLVPINDETRERKLFSRTLAGRAISIADVVQFLLYAGGSLWIIVYLWVIKADCADQSYGIPMVAICLDITWEFIYAFLHPVADKIQVFITRCWFFLDCVIVFHLYFYGRLSPPVPSMRDSFWIIVTGTLIVSFIGQITFRRFFSDFQGPIAAYITNLMISLLFIFLLLWKSGSHAVRIEVAWLKFIGTGLTIIANLLLLRSQRVRGYGFMRFLFALIILFDVIYLLLVPLFSK